MAKKKKKIGYQYGGLTGITSPNPLENIQYPTQDPMAELRRIQNMRIPGLPAQDYGVQATNPQADLTNQLGLYPGKKKKQPQTNWGDVATGSLLLANALIPNDPIRNPVVRPQMGYSPQPEGRGSQAIYKYGGPMSQQSGIQDIFTGKIIPSMNTGGKVSKTGYKRNSKDKNQPTLRIPSNQITMQDVDFPVIGISDLGDTQYMLPGGDYTFDGNYVDEFPQANMGKNLSRKEDYGSKKNPYPSVDSSDFAGGNRSYPIPSRANAIDALRLVGLHNRPDVRAKVYKKYPDLKKNYGGIIEEYQDGGIVGTPQQRQQANVEAQRLSQRYGLANAPNMQIGQYLPQYVDPAGNPSKPFPTRQLPTSVPDYINYEDIQTDQGLYWYVDPKTGDTIDVDPTVVRAKRFQKPQSLVNTDRASRTKMPSMNYGGKTPYTNMYADGGSLNPYYEEGSEHDLSEQEIANLLKKGYRIEYL